MYRHIMRIGNARYHFNRTALDAFIKEAKEKVKDGVGGAGAAERVAADEAALRRHFEEVMTLYRAYMATESVDALVRLKNRLEEVSVTYRSHVLAEEVLSINSCLPYERRVPSMAA